MKRIAVLVSGGGSNLQALMDAADRGFFAAEIGLVISNQPGVYALERAKLHHIPAVVLDHRDYASCPRFSEAILACLIEYRIDLICLAGFLRILDPLVIQPFQHRILNIHPALLPAFGGRGMYGHHVHEAVIASGARFSGATVHLVTAEPDAGPIVWQDIVEVADDDTPDSLARKVLKVEHRIYPIAVKRILENQVTIEGLRVKNMQSREE